MTGDVTYNQSFSAAANATAPGKVEKKNLTTGNNTITLPVDGGATPKSVTIIPPSGNATVITLKGVAGDTGVAIHKTDPTTLTFDTTVTTFVLNAAANVDGVQMIWT